MKCNTIIGTETLKPPSLTAAILNSTAFQSAPIQIDTNQFEEILVILSKYVLQTVFIEHNLSWNYVASRNLHYEN